MLPPALRGHALGLAEGLGYFISMVESCAVTRPSSGPRTKEGQIRDIYRYGYRYSSTENNNRWI